MEVGSFWCLFFIMYIWNYGSKLKYETKVKQKMSMDLLRYLGPNLGTVRAPGNGLLYNELAKGVPAIYGHFLTALPAVHSMIIFVCIKYGYKDDRKENHQTFEQLLIESVEKFIRREAQERSLESDSDDDSDSEEERSFSRILIAPNGSVYSLGVPLLAEVKGVNKFISESSKQELTAVQTSIEAAVDPEQSLEKELSFIRKAKESGFVYLLGHGILGQGKIPGLLKSLSSTISMLS